MKAAAIFTSHSFAVYLFAFLSSLSLDEANFHFLGRKSLSLS